MSRRSSISERSSATSSQRPPIEEIPLEQAVQVITKIPKIRVIKH